MAIKPADLIAKFRYALDNGWGYIYGATCELWSKEKQEAYAKKYIDNPDRKNSCLHGGKWAGHYVTDCSGLFAWSFKKLGGSIAHGSNSMWNGYCSAKGTLSKGSRTDGKALKPGTAVFTSSGDRHNHVGLYVGNNTVIEAMGTINGVTTTKITNVKWTHWGELKGVDYSSVSENPTISNPSETPNSSKSTSGGGGSRTMAEGNYTVTGVQVALRYGPTTKAGIIRRLATGATVQQANEPEDWVRVTHNGETGYMMKEFLKEG